MTAPSWTEIEAIGLGAGLDVVAATSAEPFEDVRQVLETRKEAGLAATMQFTYRNPARSTEPERALPGVRTLIAGATSYHRDPPDPPDAKGPLARVARYVWADDQERLLDGLGAVAAALTNAGYRACVVSDQNHLVDRAVAQRAGIGWFGKNANLLLPGRGSWFLLGAVLSDVELHGAPETSPAADACGTCERCIPACPTGAITSPGTVDARRCLSWLLQAQGEFPREHRVALGDRIYGCDDCQEVCPPNRVEVRRADTSRGVPVPLGRQDHAWVPVLELLDSTDEELLARHGRWYIAKRDPRYLRRNALMVLGNVGDGTDPQVRAALRAALEGPDDLLAAHAVWSARRLGCDDLLVNLAEPLSPDVRHELAAPVPPRLQS